MSHPSPDGGPSIDATGSFRSPPSPTHIDQLCDRFARDWRSGQRPRIEDLLGTVPDSARADLLAELIREETALRFRAGEPVTVQEYLERFPNDTKIVAGAFGDIGTMEPVGSAARRHLLHDLILLDLEHRWKQPATMQPHTETKTFAADRSHSQSFPVMPLLEDYCRAFAELGPRDKLSMRLIGQEYRVRCRWGDRRTHEEYLARFPTHGKALSAGMEKGDATLKSVETPEFSFDERRRRNCQVYSSRRRGI